MAPTSLRPHAGKMHLARLLAHTIPCARCVVYDVGADLEPTGHTTHDGDTRWIERYTKHFLTIDPMRPEQFAKTQDRLVITDWNFPSARLTRSAYYEGFMRPLGQRHKAEMFFRNAAGRVIGGARLARPDAHGPFGAAEITTLQLMQPVMESFAGRFAPMDLRDRAGLFEALSQREWEVVRWAASGLSNKDICAITKTGLPTVKSQLAAAFRKLHICRRAELIALFNLGSSALHQLQLPTLERL